jgi:hypothetical protein
MNLDGTQANKAVGTLLRRLMGNAQSRINLSDAVNEIEAVAKQYGGNFRDSVKMQMLFADELDNVFGPVARTSFKGEIGKEVQRGVAEAAAIGTPAPGRLVKGAKWLSEKSRGMSPEKAVEAIMRVLRR